MYVNTGSGEEGVLFWGLSPSDNDQMIENYKAQHGITNPCAGTDGGAPDAINTVTDGQNFLGYPTYCVVCPDRTLYFDICWPPEESCFYPYFDQCAPPLLADFSASDFDVCEGSEVQFTDESLGSIATWEWTFEGGTPETSSEQNPVVSYSSSGVFDVTLVVTDGASGSNTITSPDLIQVDAAPLADAGSSGSGCANVAFTVEDAAVENSSMVSWAVLSGEGTLEGVQTLTPTYMPAPEDAGNTIELELTAYGSGGCAEESVVAVKDLAVLMLPDVTLQPFDTLCLEWEPLELSGGMPEGGLYSGSGVDNGFFCPETAGIGVHVITYTYADENGCENYAEEEIVVTSCVGISVPEGESIRVYPNPSNGSLQLDVPGDNTFIISVTTLLGNEVFSTEIHGSSRIDISELDAGIYLLKIHDGRQEFVQRLMIK